MEPADRPASMREVEAELDRIGRSQNAPALPLAETLPPAGCSGSWRWSVAG